MTMYAVHKSTGRTAAIIDHGQAPDGSETYDVVYDDGTALSQASADDFTRIPVLDTPGRLYEHEVVVIFAVTAPTRIGAAHQVRATLRRGAAAGPPIESWWFPEAWAKHVDPNDRAPMRLVPDTSTRQEPIDIPGTSDDPDEYEVAYRTDVINAHNPRHAAQILAANLAHAGAAEQGVYEVRPTGGGPGVRIDLSGYWPDKPLPTLPHLPR